MFANAVALLCQNLTLQKFEPIYLPILQKIALSANHLQSLFAVHA
jgi:hypothetical protein